MLPWLLVGLASSLLLLALACFALVNCRRKRAREKAQRAERFLFLELHEAELKEADAVRMQVIDDRSFAVIYVFGKLEQEQHRPPMYVWADMVAEIFLLTTGRLDTPPTPGMILRLAGLEAPWVVSVCEPARQVCLVRQTAS